MKGSALLSPFSFATLVLAVTLFAPGCIEARPPTDTGDPVVATPTSPSSPTSTASPGVLAYDPDLKPLFASDCVQCHGGFRVDGGYRMTSYPEVMKNVRPGQASSKLVVLTQSKGSMYRYWSGNAQAKANQVLQWVVANNAAQTR